MPNALNNPPVEAGSTATEPAKASKDTKATSVPKTTSSKLGGILSSINLFKGKDKPKAPADPTWADYTMVETGDNADEWSLVDIFEAEALEQYMEDRADPDNVNQPRELPSRVNYTKECWDVLKVMLQGNKNKGFRQVGW